MPTTTKGKVVYKRIRHEFSIGDVVRIIRNLDPMPEEAPKLIPYVQESTLLTTRVMAALLRVSVDDFSDLVSIAELIGEVLKEIVAAGDKVSAGARRQVRNILSLAVGEEEELPL